MSHLPSSSTTASSIRFHGWSISASRTVSASCTAAVYTFSELLRWTGMDIGDAVQFRREMVDADGVLRYLRTKTDVQAVIPLAALAPQMIKLLKKIPLAPRSLENMPFRLPGQRSR